MLRFAVRRLLSLPATVLVIALVGFALVQLLPGDPVTARADLVGARGLSAADLAHLRETYGLDLPAFLNTELADRGDRVRELVTRLADYAHRDESASRLRRLGTLALPELVAAAPRLAAAATLARDLLRLAPTADQATIARAFDEHRRTLPMRVAAFVQRPTRAHRAAVWRAGTAAVPLLARALDEGRGPPRALAEILEELTSFRLPPAGNPRAAFSTWWRHHRLAYVDLGPWATVVAAFTETRFGRWMSRFLRLDLGESYSGRSVRELLAEALPVTLLVGLLALLAAYAIAIVLGTFSAGRPRGALDRSVTGLTVVALALPSPWVAVGLISLVGALPFDLFPLQGLASPGAESWGFLARAGDLLWHLILPVSCLAYGTAALLVRYQRAAVRGVLAEEYVRTARAKGLSERAVLFRHALRPSLAPLLALLAVELPWVFSGSVVVETAFDLPGMGLLTWRALLARDYPTLLGAVVLLALVAALARTAADLLAAWSDPRIAVPGRRA